MASPSHARNTVSFQSNVRSGPAKPTKPANYPRIFAEIERCTGAELDAKLSSDADLKSQINCTPKYKGTPLVRAIYAAQTMEKLEVVSVLIKHGADVSLGDVMPALKYDECLPPIFIAALIPDFACMSVLVNAGADLSVVVDVYSKRKSDPGCTIHKMNLFNWAFHTSFNRAVMSRNSPDERPRGDPLPLMLHVKILMEANLEHARDLICNHVNMAMPCQSTSMLGMATLLGAVGTANLLIELGAWLNGIGDDGDTPLDVALAFNDTDMATLLALHGATKFNLESSARQWKSDKYAPCNQCIADAMRYRRLLMNE
jgi:ankyrin repeat protein